MSEKHAYWLFDQATLGIRNRKGVENEGNRDVRERSCLDLCSDRLNARLQYWHLYFFSGAWAVLLGEVVLLAGAAATSVAITPVSTQLGEGDCATLGLPAP